MSTSDKQTVPEDPKIVKWDGTTEVIEGDTWAYLHELMP